MNSHIRIALAGAAVALVAAAPEKSVPPVATYWVDASTMSGLGGMAAGGQPDMGAIMAMMQGGPAPVAHSLRLRLASKTPAPAAAKADHYIPPALRLGPSLPLVAPPRGSAEPGAMPEIKGRMHLYWGCGERVGAGQPLTIDYAQLASGKVPESVRRAMSAMGGSRHSHGGPTSAPGYGEWPNSRDGRAVPAGASLLGEHRVEGNYSPPIAFSLGAGQDFMGPMNLAEGGGTPAGAALVRWSPVAGATGYALALFGANEAGETIMWSSANKAGFANLDYLTPADAKKAVAAGEALSPQTTQCLIPAEVARAVPMGMVMSVAYGPEVHFAEAPKNPKWAVTVRYNSRGSLMRGMAGMMGRD
jgi:hypothetical protein